MGAEEFERLAAAWGRTVELHPAGAEAGVTVKAFLQPVRERSGRQFRPTPAGVVREDRFLYLGPAGVPLSGGDGSWLSCGGTRYKVLAGHGVFAGAVCSHWRAVLRPGEGEP